MQFRLPELAENPPARSCRPRTLYKKMAKILVVEDDSATSNVVKQYLEARGHQVDIADNSKDADAFISTYFYNVMIFDWHLKGSGSGLELLQKYRAGGGAAPVLMMTSRSSIDDKGAGFDAGADDYLPKPFDGRELVMRVEALLRRQHSTAGNVITVGKLSIDANKRVAFANDKPITLRPREFALLEHFMRFPGHVFSTEALLNAVWPSEDSPSELAVRIAIKRIRESISAELGGDPIETVHKMGYVLRSD